MYFVRTFSFHYWGHAMSWSLEIYFCVVNLCNNMKGTAMTGIIYLFRLVVLI